MMWLNQVKVSTSFSIYSFSLQDKYMNEQQYNKYMGRLAFNCACMLYIVFFVHIYVQVFLNKPSEAVEAEGSRSGCNRASMVDPVGY